MAGLASLPIILLLGAYGWMRLSDTVAPGVSVGQVPIGGLRLEQAIQALDYAWNQELMITAVDTSDAGRIWAVAPAHFGLGVDAVASAERGFAYARDFPSGVVEMVLGFSNGWEIEPEVTFDAETARFGLQSLSKLTHIPATDANLGVADGEVTATEAQWGRQLDVQASLDLIAAEPASVLLEYGFVPLVTNPLPPAIEEVASAAEEAEQLLASETTLRAYDPVIGEWIAWTPTRQEATQWLRVRRSANDLSVEVDEDSVQNYVAGLQSTLGDERTIDVGEAVESLMTALEQGEAEPLQVHYLPRYYLVGPRDTLISISFKVGIPYWKWMEDNPQVKARGLVVGESLTIPPRDAMLEVPVISEKRIIVSITDQKMWLYEEDEVLTEHTISTGIPNSPTMPGLFQVKSHYVNAYASNWDLYMPHFLGIYHATPNLLNGIHGLPLLSNGVRLWENVLGRPASYGCVILDLDAAEHLYTWAEDGVVVEIRA